MPKVAFLIGNKTLKKEKYSRFFPVNRHNDSRVGISPPSEPDVRVLIRLSLDYAFLPVWNMCEHYVFPTSDPTGRSVI
jgi:hypothetical protein